MKKKPLKINLKNSKLLKTELEKCLAGVKQPNADIEIIIGYLNKINFSVGLKVEGIKEKLHHYRIEPKFKVLKRKGRIVKKVKLVDFGIVEVKKKKSSL